MAGPNTEIRYSYKHAPTLWKFANSNAFIRGLVGPWRCLPGDTEFLTPTGWKRMDAYQQGDLVAQWDRLGKLTFVEPSEYHVSPASEFIEFDNGSLTMRLSRTHRVPHLNWDNKFLVLTAEEIARKPSRRKLITTFEPPDGPGLSMSDDLIRFAVMMHADGHYPPAGQQAKVCVRKERKKQRIRWLLERLGVFWKERTPESRPTETTFSFVPPYAGKRFEGKWWSASKAQLAIVLEEMPYWDGVFDLHYGAERFCTSVKADADFMQYAAHANGHRACMRTQNYPDKPNWKPTYQTEVRNHSSYKNCAAIRETTRINRVPALNGKQYCFTVPSGFFLARCDDTIFVTGNSGKSSACCVEIVRRGQAQAPGPDGVRRTRWLVVRATVRELDDTTIRTFHEWFPPAHFGTWRASDNTYIITAFAGCVIEVMFRALDRPDDVKNLLSLEVTGAWINEGSEIGWSLIEAIQGRVMQFPSKMNGGCTWGGVFLDTNPPDTDSEWYRFFEEKEHDSQHVEIFRQPSGLSAEAENIPFLNGGRIYYERLSIGKSAEWIRVFVHGEYGYVQTGKPVFPEFSDDLHVRETNPVPKRDIYRMYDFGLTPACVFGQVLVDGRMLVFDEITSQDMGIERFADVVLDHCRRTFATPPTFIDIGDPAGMQRAQTDEKTCFQIMHAKRIMVEPGMQSLAIRLESIRKPLNTIIMGKPQFILHPRCATLRKGFLGGYRYKRMRVSGERYDDVPEKNRFSHPMDGLSYGCTRIFGQVLMTQKPLPGDKPGQQQEIDDFTSDSDRSKVTGY